MWPQKKGKNDIEHHWPPQKALMSLGVTSAQASTTSFLSLQTSFAFPRITYEWLQYAVFSVCVAGFFYSTLVFEGLTYCVCVSGLFHLAAEKLHWLRSQRVPPFSCWWASDRCHFLVAVFVRTSRLSGSWFSKEGLNADPSSQSAEWECKVLSTLGAPGNSPPLFGYYEHSCWEPSHALV